MFSQISQPVSCTLANWVPKCNNELETRLRLNFEVPLSDEVIEALPDPLQRLAAAVGKLEDGLTEGILSTEYQQSLELFEAPGTPSSIRLDNVSLTGMQIFRPTAKEGPEDQLFLAFATTVRAEGEYGDRLVTWALRHLRRTVWVKAYELQGSLPLEEEAVAAA